MSSWAISCTECKEQSWPSNILDLLDNHRDADGWFRCPAGHRAYIEKKFDLQEPGQRWNPYLRGAVCFREKDDTYQPFVFLVSYEAAGEIKDVWFSYYKDTRSSGGHLKLGHGPGGPPVLGTQDVLMLVKEMLARGCLSAKEVREVLQL